MSDTRYDVVFYGEILDGFDLNEVKANFARLFALTEAKVEQIFTASKVTLKPDLDEAVARKYQAALGKAGANVSLEAQVQSPRPLPEVQSEGLEAPLQGCDQATAEQSMDTSMTERTSETVSDDDGDTAVAGGRRCEMPFSFTGNGGEYFKIWIVNIFLSIITLGIYSAWAKVRNKQYFYGNSQLDGSSFTYLASPVTILKGRLIAFAFFMLYTLAGNFFPVVGAILGLLMLVALPWLVVKSLGFNARNSAYRNIRFNFRGDLLGAVKAFVGWPLLGVLTLGMLMPLAFYKQQRYMVRGYRYGTTDFEFHAGARDYYKIFLAVLGIGLVGGAVAGALGLLSEVLVVVAMAVVYLYLFAYFSVKKGNLVYNSTSLGRHDFYSCMQINSFARLFFVNTLATVLTLGLFVPWAKVRTANYVADHLNLNVDGNLDDFIAEEQEQISAIGEEIGDVFDFDIGF